jgi:hypothetical protein
MSAQIKGTGNSVLGGADLGIPLSEASGGTSVSTFLAATKTALNASGSAISVSELKLIVEGL